MSWGKPQTGQDGVPHQKPGQDGVPPQPGKDGVPPPPRTGYASTGYATDGMPLAVSHRRPVLLQIIFGKFMEDFTEKMIRILELVKSNFRHICYVIGLSWAHFLYFHAVSLEIGGKIYLLRDFH